MITDEILIQLYAAQSKTPEKLANSRDLICIGDQYRIISGVLYSNEDLLQRLLDLRKAGKLPRKTDRNFRKPKPQVWPSPSELRRLDGKPYYRIAIEVDVTIEHVVALLYDALMNGEDEPLSRAEVFKLLQKRIPSVLHPRENDNRAWAIARRLFPELEG